MRIGIPAETRPGETRVAGTPETVKKLAAQKHTVVVQAGAGLASSQPDDAYIGAGATIASAADALGAQMVLRVRLPSDEELARMARGTVLVGMVEPFNEQGIAGMNGAG